MTIGPDSEAAPSAFRDEVLAIARRRFPTLPLSAGDELEDVEGGGRTFYLGNLRRMVRGLNETDRAAMIADWIAAFGRMHDGLPLQAEAEAWLSVRARLRPKLLPKGACEQAKIAVCTPFLADLVITYGVDLGEWDAYVTEVMLARWNVPLAEVHAAALANLEVMSEKVAIKPMAGEGQPGRYAAILEAGAYEASLILIPAFRARLVAALGGTRAFAGIPDRNLLLAWSPDFFGRDGLIAAVSEDARTRAHPLTDTIFVVTADDVRPATAIELG